ncbi:hypothetical protein GPJ56_001170 [Histomonas meleagridis]|uniref:uncharacterized protein n=1 Tax=Histomonas meleagridis TaxID=135588 RepID=UPI003559DAEE|nr:hypothetical protein GPJ56_001170 [Histomonas meleagridis]KAH0799867.1 hypothetical protein GO595_006979 [Histomonas meleagridis]
MGSAQAKPNQNVLETRSSKYKDIFSDVNSVGLVSSFSGFNFTHLYPVNPNFNIVNSVNIKPRTYDKAHARQFNEQEYPGNYQILFIGNYMEMPFRAIFSGLWLPEVSLTVPFHPSSVTFSGSISETFSPSINIEFSNTNRLCSLDTAFHTNGSSTGKLDFEIATKYKNIRIGTGFYHDFVDSETCFEFATDIDLSKIVLGACAKIESKDRIAMVLSGQKTIGRTIAGIQLQMVPLQLSSNFVFGFEREFQMSNLSASFTSSGSVSSVYIRRITPNIRLTLSSVSHLSSRNYEFGIGVTLQ